MSKLETISSEGLAKVVGGSEPPPSYNGQDLKAGLKGGLAGARGGPPGIAVGFGWGFMKRNLGKLVDATKELYDAHQEGKRLDKQLEMLPKPPNPMQ